MLKITIYDDFFKKELSGIFETIEECKEFYAMELDTEEENIKIIKVEKC